MSISLQNWLDSKVSDDSIKNKHESTPWNLPPHSSMSDKDLSTFQKYYSGINDQDVKASDSFYTSMLENMRVISPKEIRQDPQLQLLNSVTETYKQGTHTMSVLIPPNSNRHHTNYLFKQLVDFGEYSNMNFEVSNGKETITLPYVGVDLKNAFYKFCQENSYKTI